MKSSWDETWAAFHRAVEMDTPARAAWLADLAVHAPETAAEVAELLAAHERSGRLLDRPPIAEPIGFAAGDRVGAYLLLREVGRGGMGTVYEAERDDGEYRRRVALKLVAAEHLHAGVIARFRRERQIMAALEHPDIARLLDGGTTRQGWPYLVMEFVDGIAIDRWCEQRAAPLALRLALVERIARAIDHAHRHLVVHRDIKPGNVLVDGDGRPVLLDFGIAKLLEQDAAADATVQIGARALTPRYASPEQLRGDAVSTAADLYALGVLLYELVAGSAPHAWQQSSPERLAERIERDTPPRLARAAEKRATERSEQGADAVETTRLRQERIPPELDWIVRKAMAARHDARYPSALALAEDLQRLRSHQPVQARAPTLAYRLRKSLRRHWLGYAVAVGFVVLAAAFALRLGIESQRTRAALLESQQQRRHADDVAAFLAALFELADRTQAEGRDVSAREILDRGRARLAAQQNLAPIVRARLLGSLARVYRNMGAYPIALQLLDEAGAMIEPAAHPRQHAEWLRDRGSVLELQGANAAARDALAAALTGFEALGDAHAIEGARTAKLLAVSLQSLGEREAAGAMFARADADFRRLPQAGVDDRADGALRLGSWFWVGGDFAAAGTHYARALSLRRAERPANLPELARALDANGALAHALGRYPEAVQKFEEALALRRQVLGEQHRLTADSLSNLGAALVDQGRPDAAEAPLTEAVRIFEAVLPADSPVLAKTLNNLGLVRQQQRDYAGARALFERALAIHRRALGDRHPKLAANLNNLGLVDEQVGDFANARARFGEALALQQAALGADHVGNGFTLTNLGRIALWTGDLDTARAELEQAAVLRATLPAAHPLRADTDAWLGVASCLDPAERARGRTLLDRVLAQHSDAQALAIEELQALHLLCADRDVDTATWQQRVDAVEKLRGAAHPLVRFLRSRQNG